jgi:hypothetical protein
MTLRRQVSVLRRRVAGPRTHLQLVPSHRSIRAPWPVPPTAQALDAEVAATPNKLSPGNWQPPQSGSGAGLGTSPAPDFTRGAVRGNGPGAIPAPRLGPTQRTPSARRALGSACRSRCGAAPVSGVS